MNGFKEFILVFEEHWLTIIVIIWVIVWGITSMIEACKKMKNDEMYYVARTISEIKEPFYYSLEDAMEEKNFRNKDSVTKDWRVWKIFIVGIKEPTKIELKLNDSIGFEDKI